MNGLHRAACAWKCIPQTRCGAGWGGVRTVLMPAVCLLILFILMKEAKGERLKIEDYLHYSCVIIEKIRSLNSS